MRRTHVPARLLIVGIVLCLAGGAAAEPSASSPAARCPRYELLMKGAAQSLRAGDRPAALEKLRLAKSALDACEIRATTAARQIG